MQRQAVLLGAAAILSLILFFGLADNLDLEPIILKSIGSVLTVIFILAGAAKAKKMKDKNAGILLNAEGIQDLSSEINVGFIKWKDITVVNKQKSIKFGLLLIDVKKNDLYIKNAKNSAIARLLRQNVKLYNTPIAINASNLDCTLEELVDQIKSHPKS